MYALVSATTLSVFNDHHLLYAYPNLQSLRRLFIVPLHHLALRMILVHIIYVQSLGSNSMPYHWYSVITAQFWALKTNLSEMSGISSRF